MTKQAQDKRQGQQEPRSHTISRDLRENQCRLGASHMLIPQLAKPFLLAPSWPEDSRLSSKPCQATFLCIQEKVPPAGSPHLGS